MLAFTAKTLMTPTDTVQHPLVLVADGKILEIAARAARPVPAGVQVLDLGDGLLAPGYVDLHIHGGAGFDVMDAHADALATVERLIVRSGVTEYFPTTVTAPLDTTLRALERLADAIENRGQDNPPSNCRACPLGIHLEGPFISHIRKGVHPAADLLPPKLETFDRFWQAARGRVRMMTIAPELDGAAEVIAEATRRGVCVSLGHSDADFSAS